MNQDASNGGECARMRPQLDPYLSDELAVQEREEVRRHLKGCAACTRELEADAGVRTALQDAVKATPVPAGLESRVRSAIQREPARRRSGVWAIAAAAVVILGVSLVSMWRDSRSPEDTILAKTTGRLAEVFKVGLTDHLQCAVFRKYPKNAAPASMLAAELGWRFAGLAPQVQAKLPANSHIVQAHLCTVRGRRYTHFIIADGDKVISLILTEKRPGEDLGMGLRQESVDRFQVVCFESAGYLAYVISDLSAGQDLEWAANLAPAVREFLASNPG